MSAADLSEYMAFNTIEPIGELRADYRAASISSAIVNSMGSVKKPVTIKDMLLQWVWKEPEVETPRTLAARIKALLNSKAGM